MRGIRKQLIGSDQPPVTTDFEVRCDDCEVSFPVGTKRCMYCGGRPGHRPLFARQVGLDPLEDIELLSQPFESDGSVHKLDAPIDEDGVEQPRGSIFRLFGNLSWVILFALITLYRACTG